MKLILFFMILCLSCTSRISDIYLGMGAKVGEVTENRAILHVRLTTIPEQDSLRLFPGKAGEARVRYGIDEQLKKARLTKWLAAKKDDDFSIQFHLDKLVPNQRYYYQVEMRVHSGEKPNKLWIGSFRTTPRPDERDSVKFQVTTGQDLRGVDTYHAMAAQHPDFLVSTGDNVYYDSEPVLARTVPLAYRKYQEMYGSKPIVDYFRHVAGYFEKDDHDYRFNDSDSVQKGKWLSKKWLEPGLSKVTKEEENRYFEETWLSHEEGMMVFKQVFPMSEKTYRTFRWGKGVQIWLLEGRDFRSPNAMPDGPDKTIWGKEQKEWLKETLLKSDTDFRVVISPTPIIGPDRQTKRDNHANWKGFWTEGQTFLQWIADNKLTNLILVCGDRHWQYHSIDKRGIHELCCGPICDEHSVRGKSTQIVPKAPEEVQPYYNLCGGFLTVTYSPRKALNFSFHGEKGELLYQYKFPTGK